MENKWNIALITECQKLPIIIRKKNTNKTKQTIENLSKL